MSQVRKQQPTPVKRKPAVSAKAGVPVVPLPRPNVDDPLSEATRHRRIWAAYLKAGLSRREFADRLGTNYHTVNRWDAGAAVMSLEMLERAVPLLGYTMDELCFGRRGAPQPSAAPAPVAQPAAAALTDADIRALLDLLRVDPSTRAAFGEHTASPAGRYQTLTPAYVETWCAAYAATGDATEALQAAVNARAVTEAVKAGVRSVTSDTLRAALRGKP